MSRVICAPSCSTNQRDLPRLAPELRAAYPVNINNAILHVFDFVSCVNVFAQAPMDLGNKAAKRYVTSQAKRALGNLDSKRGTFAENSLFAEELRLFPRRARFRGAVPADRREFIVGELSRMEGPRPTCSSPISATPTRRCAR
ncbi:MAG: hypothetical protein ACLTDR_10980 [Adlercreutzia equolifaciens]